ncbi:MAG: EamA family transporter [Thermoplasmataceae archaeon]
MASNSESLQAMLHIRSLILAIVGASLFGVSGTLSSILFRVDGMPFSTLVSLRMLVAGVLALAIMRPSFPRISLFNFLVFSIVGIFGVQITYLATISYSDAPTATLLQYLFFPMVMIYELARKRIKLSVAIIISLILALGGTFELTTSFPAHSATILLNPLALLFGLLSALTAALYTIMSGPIVRQSKTLPAITWSFVIGGLFSIIFSFNTSYLYFSRITMAELPGILILVILVAVFGTLVAFGLYIKSMQEITATQASLAGTMEPITAALSSSILLGVVLTGFQYLGGAMIIAAILVVQVLSFRNWSPRKADD